MNDNLSKFTNIFCDIFLKGFGITGGVEFILYFAIAGVFGGLSVALATLSLKASLLALFLAQGIFLFAAFGAIVLLLLVAVEYYYWLKH